MGSRSETKAFKAIRVEKWSPPNGVGVDTSITSQRYDYTDSISYDSNVFRGKNWRQAIADRENATTGYSGVIHKTETAPTGFGYATAPGHTSRVSGHLHLSPPRSTLSGITASKADSNARIAFINNYRQTRQSFQGGVFLGELRETLHMIKHPLQSFRRGLDFYHSTVKRRLKGRRAHPAGDIIAGTWLEYSFGWQPLVNDVRDAMKALAETVAGKWVGDTIYASGEDNNQVGTTTSVFNYFVSDPFTGDFHYVRKGDASVRYKGWVGSKINDPPSLSENWGVNLGSLVPTVWELIPYSFLVDYFTNAGDVISAVSQGSVSLRWGWKTTKISGSVYLARSSIRADPGWKGSCSCFPGLTSQTVSVARQPVSSVAVGLSDFHWEIPMNPTKWLNIGALARLRI